MFATTFGPGSVPAKALLIEAPNGELYVGVPDGTDWQAPARGPVLAEFAALARADVPGEAVVRFVERFGRLHLCQEHERNVGTLEHRDCTPLRPEPLSLWIRHSGEVGGILGAARTLEAGEEPDPFGLADAQAHEPRAHAWEHRMGLTVERERRAVGSISHGTAADLHQSVDQWADALADQSRTLDRERAQLGTLLPDTPAGWREWITGKITGHIMDYPVSVRLQVSPRGGFTLALDDSGSLLARVYFELAQDVAGAAAVAFCSSCALPYTALRRPKAGQRNYCPECRAANVPQRMYMRERRKQ
jgi:hypothetical protein